MDAAIRDPDLPIRFIPKFREHGIDILDGGSSYKLLAFCPWCGEKPPDSLREKWFDRLGELGVDPADDESVPDEYRDHRWYVDRK